VEGAEVRWVAWGRQVVLPPYGDHGEVVSFKQSELFQRSHNGEPVPTTKRVGGQGE
jgi:hypothetical protein